MSQKVKIQTGFSEKSTENYQSQQYSVALEMDCTINGSTREIEEASNKLFALCRKIVSAQKGVNVDTLLNNETLPVSSGASQPALAPAQTPPAGPSAAPRPRPRPPMVMGLRNPPPQSRFVMCLSWPRRSE